MPPVQYCKGINPNKITYIFAMMIRKAGQSYMRVKEKMTGLLSLPKEIALDLPLIMATGREEINIENYKNLIEFTDTKIRIHTTAGTLTIAGQRLMLKQITTEHILITGRIKGVQW